MDLTTSLIITLIPSIASILAIVATVIGAISKFKGLVSDSEKENAELKKQLKACVSETIALSQKNEDHKAVLEAFINEYNANDAKIKEELYKITSCSEISSQNQILINEIIKTQETFKSQMTALIKEVRNGEKK